MNSRPLTTNEIAAYWNRDSLGASILEQLAELKIDPHSLNSEILAPFDQFHGGGREMTLRQAALAKLVAELEVLDLGAGLGGPARTLAELFGCQVTALDLTPGYVAAAAHLTKLTGLEKNVRHLLGNSLQLPFAAESFDLVWSQNSGMNIKDKSALYAEVYRVLRPGGRLVIQEPIAGPVQPPIFPLMWARDQKSSFLLSAEELKETICSQGFLLQNFEDVTAAVAAVKSADPQRTIQKLVMQDELELITRASQRNREEERIKMLQAVFLKDP
jgi:SAM-dependent methyltransferase